MGVTFHARPRPLPPSEPRRDDAAVLRSNPPPADGTLVLRRYGCNPKIDQFCLAQL